MDSGCRNVDFGFSCRDNIRTADIYRVSAVRLAAAGVPMNKVKLFLWAQAFTDKVPETLSRTVFELIGTAVGLSNLRGVRRLRKNCRRIAPLSSGPGQRLRSARIMRSYLRYYHGALRLPALTAGQIRAFHAVVAAGKRCGRKL